MNTLARAIDFDDARGLVDADRDGLLRAAASAGAQVRSVASAVEEGVLVRLDGLRPRSVVLIAVRGSAAHSSALLTAAFAGRFTVPVLFASAPPLWIGPLDIVVAAGDDAGDRRLLESVDVAARRGAEVVVVAPDEGPLRAASAGRAMVLPPRIPVPDSFGLWRYLAAQVAVLATLGVLPNVGLAELNGLADALDDEARSYPPDREIYRNPAKSLAERISGRKVVVAGDAPATRALAEHCAAVLLRVAGVTAVAADLADVLAALPVLVTPGSGSKHDLLFHDEELDGPVPGDPVRVLVLATEADKQFAAARSAAIGDFSVIVAETARDGIGGRGLEGEPAPYPPFAGGRPDRFGGAVAGQGAAREVDPGQRSAPRQPDGLGDIAELALLASRFEMAAAYLRVAGVR